MEDSTKINVTTVAFLVGVTVQTVTSWYKWKELNPDHELAKLLPNYTRGTRNARLWDKADIWKLIKFKDSIPQGRNGLMGAVTQKYVNDNFRNRKEG